MRMRKYIILCGIILSSLFAVGCGEEASGKDVFSAISDLAENAGTEQRMEFREPAIEERTRVLLEKPEGVIMKADVLTITEFGFDIWETEHPSVTAPFLDLQWYRNLESVSLPSCDMKSMEGVEKLTSLRELWVNNNEITDIDQVRGLTGLTSFSCDGNPVADYSPIRELVNLEHLGIGHNGASYTDLSPLCKLTKLKSLYAPWCGVSDISVLSGLTELEELRLSRNEITDISALKGLRKLTTLQLEQNEISDISALEGLDKLTLLWLYHNKITDIEPLYGLPALNNLTLDGNEIPGDALAAFYEEKRGENFTVSIDGRLREDMPEFTFELTTYYDLQSGYYPVQTIVVRDGDTVLQTISIPELTFWGQTANHDTDTLGFTLEDVNFDGYQDIRLYDTPNGNYRVEWIYLVWNPAANRFEQDKRLNEISLAQFDQEKQLIYGMERGGAAYHYFSTYQYIDGEIVKIRYEEEEGLWQSDEQIRQYYEMAGKKTDAESFEGYYHHVMEQNETTGELETTLEEYIFFPVVSEDGDDTEDGNDTEESEQNGEELHVDVSSELGQKIGRKLKDIDSFSFHWERKI